LADFVESNDQRSVEVGMPEGSARAVAPVVVVPESNDYVLEALSHELRSPVKAVQLLAEAVRASVESLSPEQVRRFMEAILRSTGFMGELLERLAEASGGVLETVRRRPVDVGSLVLETLEDMAGLLRSHRVRVDVSDGRWADFDPLRVRQVLVNLLSNAAKFSPPGSTVTVELSSDARGIEVAVSDRCSGIHPDDRARIFERFQRAHDLPEGSGLGLYVARTIARAHGGDVTVGPGDPDGCRFALALPWGR
jgi:signal transduction histidine kinase